MNREFTPDRRGFLSGLQQNLKVIFTSVKTENRGDLKRIFGVMGLCAKKGDEITVTISGKDEDAAAEKIEALFKENL